MVAVVITIILLTTVITILHLKCVLFNVQCCFVPMWLTMVYNSSTYLQRKSLHSKFCEISDYCLETLKCDNCNLDKDCDL